MQPDLTAAEFYLNRELSWLKFNQRVLDMASDVAVPLLERLRYLFIFSANLDEYFEIRVAGLREQLAYGTNKPAADGLTLAETLKLVTETTHHLVERQYTLLTEQLMPAMAKENIYFLYESDWNEVQQTWIKKYFTAEILPVISPVGLDLARPFPRLVNKSLNFIVTLVGEDAFGRNIGMAIIHVSRSIPRVIRLPDELVTKGDSLILLSSIVHAHADSLFPGMTVTGCHQFRVTRNSDFLVDEDEVDDLPMAVKSGLLARRYGTSVRLEIAKGCPEKTAAFLLNKLHLTLDDLFYVDGPVNLARFTHILKLIHRPDLQYPPLNPGLPKELEKHSDLFSTIRSADILLHHPYQAFTPIINFLHQAALDPKVIAIKQTLYRSGANSALVDALVEAAKAGKEVTTVIELRARFDEADNLLLANRLQEAGALVVYGVVGYKAHAKMSLIVRRENNDLRYYAHISTGNYHAKKARIYSDFGLLTYNQEIAEDVNKIFYQLTGMGKFVKLKQLIVAPFTLYKTLNTLIQRETQYANNKKPAYIIAKMNALTDPSIIQTLYRAAQAGVKIELIVRGICCLRPGVAGVSENIKVRSVVGRFLEHARIWCFANNGEEEIYCTSADWMERSFFHRVEVCYPVLDKKLKKRVKQEGLTFHLQDNSQSWILQADGSYVRRPSKHNSRNAQKMLLKKLTHKT